MQAYLDLLKTIQEKGTHKNAARFGMPGTTSLFGYQFRHNLADGFPLLTTKKMFWKGIVVELLWFLRGDTNIQYLIDNDVHIWDKDAYNYYRKQDRAELEQFSFNQFMEWLGVDCKDGYTYGDCGFQYGKVWRNWEDDTYDGVDQIKSLITGLQMNPESRRHILTSIDPAHQDNLALYWCHALSQFNCRPLTEVERKQLWNKKMDREFKSEYNVVTSYSLEAWNEYFDAVMKADGIPKYYLDCQMYQRSADIILGVPFNIASYALLTHILCKLCNMIPGEMIYTYGDVHIYDNHIAAVDEQLQREPRTLPKLQIENQELDWDLIGRTCNFNKIVSNDFKLINYDPHPKLENEAELNTGI